ncbi:MAG TPA: hypothetical protein EYQ00_05405 [Dehalococcoidia bacterium]|jgi:hypothetical protein|nr:hypothetical protein [Dehalococcoidia bacterium]
MKIGDMVEVKACPDYGDASRWTPQGTECTCFFCASGSNRIGVVTAVAPRNAFHIMFDTGMWRLDMFDEARGDVKVIRASR